MTRESENRWALGLGSAALSLIVSALIWDLQAALLMVVVIAFHELGHAVVMRALGYQVAGIVFVPALGGLTLGMKANASRRDTIASALAGPLPGIALALVLLGLGVDRTELGLWLIFMLLWINLLNLLPVLPFDGGRVLAELVSLRTPSAQSGLRWGSVITLGGLGILWRDPWALVPIAMLVAVQWWSRGKPIAARQPQPPLSLEDVSLLLLYLAGVVAGAAGLVWLFAGGSNAIAAGQSAV